MHSGEGGQVPTGRLRWEPDRPTAARVALSWLYGAGRSVHRAMYDRGLRRRRRLGSPVICVGNLSVGGTGKTPFLIGLAAELRRRGWRPAILSRGYGAEPPAREPRIVSDGAGFFAEVARSGDEPALLARRCPGVPVVIGASRFEAGRLAEKEFAPEVFLLDDGFQHEALERDADLVLWDVRDRPEEMRLLPAGRLREPLAGLRRATVLVLTHGEYLDSAQAEAHTAAVERELKAAAPGVPIFHAASRLTGCREMGAGEGGGLRPIRDWAGECVFLVSGLARPEGFETMVAREGLRVAGHLRLPDHARYDAAAVAGIQARAQNAGARRVLTTAKDAVKLEGLADGGMAVAELEMSVVETQAWDGFLDRILPRRKPEEAGVHD